MKSHARSCWMRPPGRALPACQVNLLGLEERLGNSLALTSPGSYVQYLAVNATV